LIQRNWYPSGFLDFLILTQIGKYIAGDGRVYFFPSLPLSI